MHKRVLSSICACESFSTTCWRFSAAFVRQSWPPGGGVFGAPAFSLSRGRRRRGLLGLAFLARPRCKVSKASRPAFASKERPAFGSKRHPKACFRWLGAASPRPAFASKDSNINASLRGVRSKNSASPWMDDGMVTHNCLLQSLTLGAGGARTKKLCA